MKLVRMDELFDIKYGRGVPDCKRDLPPGNIPVISSGDKDNGVYGYFNVEPRYENVIMTARNFGGIAFYHPYKCSTGGEMLVLTPIQSMQHYEMMYYCEIIRMMKFKYSYGRKVTPKRLGSTLVPAEILEWANVDPSEAIKVGEEKAAQLLKNAGDPIDTTNWQWFYLTDLFNAEVGNAPSIRVAEENIGDTPYVSASTLNNGIACYTSLGPITNGNKISMVKIGEPGVCFYQQLPFVASSNVMILHPKFELTKNRALFLIPLIELNKTKYSYGRVINTKRLSTDKIKLPVKSDDSIDWDWIDEFMKGVK